MKLYGTPASRTRRVLWALEEVGAHFELVHLDLRAGEHRRPEYAAINPNAKVPTLQDGDLTLFESAAICTYIGDRHPESGLVPEPRTPERALYDQWMFFAVAELEQPLWSMGKHTFVLPAELRVPRMLEVARFEWSVAAGVLAGALAERRTIVGDRFTMADILLAHTLFWARGFDVPLGHERLEEYADEHLARPAFLRTMEKGRYRA